MPTVQQDIKNLNGVNFIAKLKSLFTKLDEKAVPAAAQVEAITALEGSVVVADISAKVDEILAALKAADVTVG